MNTGDFFIDVGAASEVAPGDVLAFRVRDRDFVVCNAAGTLYALADRCTHAAWSLAGSELRGCEIVCSLHGARFDVRDGTATAPPASKSLSTFPIRERNGRIEVQVAAPPR